MQTKASAKLSSNWLINEILAGLNEEKKNIGDCPITPENLGEMLKMIENKELSGKMAKKVFTEMWKTKEDPKQIVKKKGLKRISDTSILTNMVTEVIEKFPKQVEDYKNGREKIFGFFVGEIMKSSRGQADPEQLNKILKEKLKN